MVWVLKKGASKKEIHKIEAGILSVKPPDLSKYFGKIKLKVDPLLIQQQLRDEWK